ncbi:hypothetical protein [Halorarum halobium]|uniref:hypothetical protein n=1 Tax=Halorarum halobium TaxID=3075121 RepID=UPI0028A59A80|nr:hypothetical protein [Halobaculum sp. XH14]
MTDAGEHGELISFVATGEDGTLEVRDELESQRLRLTVPDLAEFTPAATESFRFPVDDAVALTTLLAAGSDAPDALYYEPAGDGAVPDAVVAALAAERCPPVVLAGAPLAPEQERRLVASGLVAGLSFGRRPTVAALGRGASMLLLGHGLERSAALADLPPERRAFGAPGTVLVRREHGLGPIELDVRSRTEDDHVVVRTVRPVGPFSPGSVTRVRNENPDDSYHLVGTPMPQAHVHSTAEVVDLLVDDDFVVRLNGDVYRGEDDATAALVRESAREAGD